jgi:metal-responsive CopG/Arc/MetJ family transcriptional regulator
MHRTQIYLDHETNAALDRLAKRMRISKGEIIRTATREYLSEKADGIRHPLWELVGMARSGYSDTSERHDEILSELALKSHLPA